MIIYPTLQDKFEKPTNPIETLDGFFERGHLMLQFHEKFQAKSFLEVEEITMENQCLITFEILIHLEFFQRVFDLTKCTTLWSICDKSKQSFFVLEGRT
jgi:hypothetical protein